MPNDCSNSITIISILDSEISTMVENEIRSLPDIHISQQGEYGIRFTYTSAWKADYEWLYRLHQAHPTCWIKNQWIAEDGHAGIWIAEDDNISHMEWNDLSYEDEHYMFT